ncbi:hypothetical protein RUND412_009553 [Rhizina undulata]
MVIAVGSFFAYMAKKIFDEAVPPMVAAIKQKAPTITIPKPPKPAEPATFPASNDVRAKG